MAQQGSKKFQQEGRPVYLDDDNCIRTIGEVVVTLTKAPPNLQYLEAWSAEVDRVAREHQGLINVVVIVGAASVPSDEAKKLIREAMVRHQNVLRGAVYVVEASGFLAAAMRSALSLTGLMARYPFPQKTFGQIRDADEWIRSLLAKEGRAKGSARLEPLVDEMRSELKIS